MRTDPADTGGLFVGRRPGTAPIHYRAPPQLGTVMRRRIDGYFAGALLGTMTAVSLLCWGPVPLACLWIGSEVDYVSGSLFLGIVAAFIALFPMLFGALAILRRLDEAWLLVRRAAGHDQRVAACANLRGDCGALRHSLYILAVDHPRPRFGALVTRLAGNDLVRDGLPLACVTVPAAAAHVV